MGTIPSPSHSLVFFGPSSPLFTLPVGNLDIVRRRFSTRTEITLNVLALFAAVAAGSAQVCASTISSPSVSNLSTNECFLQPLMTLIFGNLTQDFLNFSNAIQNINPNDPQTTATVEEAARDFRHVAAQDASYLTYIGAGVLV